MGWTIPLVFLELCSWGMVENRKFTETKSQPIPETNWEKNCFVNCCILFFDHITIGWLFIVNTSISLDFGIQLFCNDKIAVYVINYYKRVRGHMHFLENKTIWMCFSTFCYISGQFIIFEALNKCKCTNIINVNGSLHSNAECPV